MSGGADTMGLTAREREIYHELVTTPGTCKAIARRRGVSHKTIETQCLEIYRKMGFIARRHATDRRAALIQHYYSSVLENVRRTQAGLAVQEEYHFQTSAAVPLGAVAARATPPEALVASPLAASPGPDTEPAATISARGVLRAQRAPAAPPSQATAGAAIRPGHGGSAA